MMLLDLTEILRCPNDHAESYVISAPMTMDGKDVATVAGPTVKVKVDGSTVMVNDATVTAADITASNGVIHVIDKVLLPPS